MREIRLSGSEGGGPKPIASPYPYLTSITSKPSVDRRVATMSFPILWMSPNTVPITHIAGLLCLQHMSFQPSALRDSVCQAARGERCLKTCSKNLRTLCLRSPGASSLVLTLLSATMTKLGKVVVDLAPGYFLHVIPPVVVVYDVPDGLLGEFRARY